MNKNGIRTILIFKLIKSIVQNIHKVINLTVRLKKYFSAVNLV